MSDLMSWPFCG